MSHHDLVETDDLTTTSYYDSDRQIIIKYMILIYFIITPSTPLGSTKRFEETRRPIGDFEENTVGAHLPKAPNIFKSTINTCLRSHAYSLFIIALITGTKSSAGKAIGSTSKRTIRPTVSTGLKYFSTP